MAHKIFAKKPDTPRAPMPHLPNENLKFLSSVANSFTENSKHLKDTLKVLKTETRQMELSCLRTATVINDAYIHVIKKIEETYRQAKGNKAAEPNVGQTLSLKSKVYFGLPHEKMWAKINDYIKHLAERVDLAL
ncbi:Uncharacterised protein (plasmid) [Legionella adelaidensis]|uniref:Coiled-coil protein n=1 Tax=Legionella adelaidensis TaxID=45056 RepID=A0A0W0R2Y9_9GAMM|nr:hypothetical protein [Legionella adelaidensis]KTC65428.1 hypothetical protein Lade_0086 [Legionella adelaidensis]VEH84750.1 Uncharacterised protein [Legionella adelaidensis]